LDGELGLLLALFLFGLLQVLLSHCLADQLLDELVHHAEVALGEVLEFAGGVFEEFVADL
jgi:hypothetical protein